MRKLVTGVLGCLMLLFATGVNAQEAEAAPEVKPVDMKVQFKYDLEELKKAADEEGSGEVYGQVVRISGDGVSSETNAFFSITKEGDTYSNVTYREVDDYFTASNVFMMFCAILVFIMHLGFATLETGLTRAKNTVNILFTYQKN